jgi:hypothetical protein
MYFKIANEAYKLTLSCNNDEPISPSRLVCARGDTSAFQVLLNSDNHYSVNIGKTEWFSNGCLPVLKTNHERFRLDVVAPFDVVLNIEEFVTDDDGIKKADILLHSDSRDSTPNTPSAVFAEIKIPADAEAGDYEVKVNLYSSFYACDEQLVGSYTLPLKVYPITLPDYRDWSFYLDLWQHNSNIARHYDVRLWSDEHFAVIEKVIESLARLGQKSITVIASEIPWSGQSCAKSPIHGGNMFEYSMIGITKNKCGEYIYDYSKMQRYIDICTASGMSGDIEVFGLVNLWAMDLLGTPDVDYVEPIRLRYYDESDGMMKYVSECCVVEHYISSLEKYFVATNQISRVRVAADEPGDIDKYRKSLAKIRTIAPDFRYKTAINHAEFIEEFGDVIDDFAPYLYCVCDKFEILKEYQKRFSGKRFLWYVCCGDGRPNTQLRQHLTEARMIGSINYHFGFDGFLRWAYTIWPENPRLDARYSFFECGDTALVYPAYNGDVLLSLRYKGLLRGISDYELLKLLDKKGKKEYAASLVASLFEVQDLAAYKEMSKDTRRGAHSHDWEDFNDMKASILEELR